MESSKVPNRLGSTITSHKSSHIAVLDGWRAVSILLVLAGHMLPLGPKTWGLNAPVAALGMAIFFALSGFLIVSILHRDNNIPKFLIRRAARIIPLAWLILTLVFISTNPAASEIAANFLFYANLPPFYLDRTGHFWSLCVEVQFYIAISLNMYLFRNRALYLIPFAAICITSWRIYSGVSISIITLWRLDEILAGGSLALIINTPSAVRARQIIAKMPIIAAGILFLPSTAMLFSPLDYARPYICTLLIGATILQPGSLAARILNNRVLRYLAKTSYAIYIIHPYTMAGWLGEGTPIIKYSKRIISFIITFSFAHFSSFYYESIFSRWAHRITSQKVLN